MATVFLTFVVTTALYVVLTYLLGQRIAKHLQDNPEAVKAVTEHLLVPLLGKKKEDADQKKPASRNTDDAEDLN